MVDSGSGSGSGSGRGRGGGRGKVVWLLGGKRGFCLASIGIFANGLTD